MTIPELTATARRLVDARTLSPELRVGLRTVFPFASPLCSCGCGMHLQGAATRWATRDCRRRARHLVWLIEQLVVAIEQNDITLE